MLHMLAVQRRQKEQNSDMFQYSYAFWAQRLPQQNPWWSQKTEGISEYDTCIIPRTAVMEMSSLVRVA